MNACTVRSSARAAAHADACFGAGGVWWRSREQTYPLPVEGAPVPVVARRVTDAERDSVVRVLGEAVSDGRLSHDTFLARLDAALLSKDEAALGSVVADLVHRSMQRQKQSRSGRIWPLRFARVEPVAWPALVLPNPAKPFVSLGRSTASDMCIDEPTVSGIHAGLLLFAGSWFVVDRNSTNGTFVNECRVPEVAQVHPGDLLGLGCVAYRLTAPRSHMAIRTRVKRLMKLPQLGGC